MEKIVIVVADGRVESVFTKGNIEVEVVDFDGVWDDPEESEKLSDYVDECRETMHEIVC